MKNSYLVYSNIGGDCFPAAVCAERSDAEELCLAYAEEELYRRWYIDIQMAHPRGINTIFTVQNLLKNMPYNILEVPYYD